MLVVVGMLFTPERSTAGCGLESRIPTDHFYGVDGEGRVNLWFEIGKLPKLGSGSFPIAINFNSARNGKAGLLGAGWIIPIFESRMVQLDENRFEMLEPNGVKTSFRRGPIASTLVSTSGWAGELREDEIVVKGCNGGKLTFKKGQLSKVESGSDSYSISIRSDGFAELRGATGNVITLEERTDGGKTLTVGEKRIELSFGERPVVNNVGGKNLVTAVSKTLTGISVSDGEVMNAEFGVTPSLDPTLKIVENRGKKATYTWNASTGHIICDDDWTYELPGVVAENGEGPIKRTSKANAGSVEFWQSDPGKGIQLAQRAGGPLVKTIRFASGPLTGKLRRIEEERDGQTSITRELSFDEKGRILRDVGSGKSLYYRYDDDSRTWTAYSDAWDNLMWKRQFSKVGTLEEIHYPNGQVVRIKPASDGQFEATMQKEGKTAKYAFPPTESLQWSNAGTEVR